MYVFDVLVINPIVGKKQIFGNCAMEHNDENHARLTCTSQV
jgi:hypothetical protein